ncbi:hypothetical protein A5804_000662 [Enterococcus faecium]|uniref:Uncharacterized protein n=2 Tax=Enterococcus faecium TaxID=1352 RepID=A0AB73NIL4_ENTFC|nr:hypothetical protein A5804_000662 [Enterococcus faecium]
MRKLHLFYSSTGVYTLCTIIFSVKLNRLNHYLLENGYDANPLELLQYNDYQAVKYFLYTLFYEIVGTILVVYYFNKFKNGLLENDEAIAAFVSIIVIIVLLVLLIYLIDNPILKAITIVVIVGFGLLYGNSK